MTRSLFGAVVFSILAFQASIASAGGCGDMKPPSPATNIPTGVRFTNDTQYTVRIYWTDFDGQLRDYGLVQPDESVGFKTYVHHRWYAELYMSDEALCAGPISAPDTETCDMRLMFDGERGMIDMDGGYCDY
ncbi:hypothetical protein [Rhodopseudomonas palustris]|uniref:VHL beta domain-containing protein n=1 Tax=Rhodopseudomonas palustris TaxID=1076 RepID=UPI0009A50FAC|nr:hypothetical protein [Rhodopseudomonas palustris]